MPVSVQDFTKRHEYLICVDSDGCALDTMEIKHKSCFAPCLITEWQLQNWRDAITRRWSVINLYSMTRGINRFKGLAMALEEINKQYTPIEGITVLKQWVKETNELSNPALEAEISRHDTPILRKTLSWSNAVNKAFAALPWDKKKAFHGVMPCMTSVRVFADVAVVSSAKRDAVEKEWENLGLLDLADIMLCQEIGSKSHCIAELKKKGYAEQNILMVGDAPGDKAAAELNGVYYYPIRVRHEEESWSEFPEAVRRFKNGTYREYGFRKSEEFLVNLSVEDK
jgi:phosphoglycolate phosphatase-like HAD superfamily hydrolase